MTETGPERKTLDFRRGMAGAKFQWVSYYGGFVVGLCSYPYCAQNCGSRLGEFSGGPLEVDLELRTNPTKATKFYVAHFVRHVESEANQTALWSPRLTVGGGLSESDAAGLTAFCYTDSVSGQSLLIDCGTPPGYNGDSLERLKQLVGQPGLQGCAITHGHFDHWSLFNQMPDSLPVFVDPLAAEFIVRHLEFRIWQIQEEGGDTSTLSFRKPREEEIFDPGESFRVGSFSVQSILTAHAIPNASMLLIQAPSGKRILDTGDFKFNGMDWREKFRLEMKLREIGQAGVDVMRCDNLNAHLPGFTLEESNAVKGVVEAIAATKGAGRVVVALFGSNLNRIEAVASAALELFDRPLIFAGASMKFANRLLSSLRERVLPVGGEPMDRSLVFATGCQAEEGSILHREVVGGNPFLWLSDRDTVILSSRAIPGNEASVKDLVERLLRRGCKIVLHEGETSKLGLEESGQIQEALVHVSGHGHADDARLALELVRPKKVVPAVLSSPQIEAFREIASSLGIEVIEPVENRIVL